MTHKSLFKEVAQHFVQRGQMPEPLTRPTLQADASEHARGFVSGARQMSASPFVDSVSSDGRGLPRDQA